MALPSQRDSLVTFVRAAGPSLPVTKVLGLRGVAAELGGQVIGTDLGWSTARAESGHDRGLGVPV